MKYTTERISYEVAVAAAKIAFFWNSTEGSSEEFQKDLADILIDMPDDQIMNKARRIDYAKDNNERVDITSPRQTGRLAKML